MEENNILLDKEQLHYLLKGNATRIGNQNGWEPFITAFIFVPSMRSAAPAAFIRRITAAAFILVIA